MREEKKKSEKLLGVIKSMPYFTVENLFSLGLGKHYIKVQLSRLKKRGEIISLKRGVYVSRSYVKDLAKDGLNVYLEFLSNELYSPSYLSTEYVLSEYNVLSEAYYGFSGVSTKKTNRFTNELGDFNYYHLKKDLFTGFDVLKDVLKKGDFYIYKATPAKALFDYLYLRKNLIVDHSYFRELRLNLENLRQKDLFEFKKYLKIEGGPKMAEIYNYLHKDYYNSDQL